MQHRRPYRVLSLVLVILFALPTIPGRPLTATAQTSANAEIGQSNVRPWLADTIDDSLALPGALAQAQLQTPRMQAGRQIRNQAARLPDSAAAPAIEATLFGLPANPAAIPAAGLDTTPAADFASPARPQEEAARPRPGFVAPPRVAAAAARPAGLSPAATQRTILLPFIANTSQSTLVDPVSGGSLRTAEGGAITFAPGAVTRPALATYAPARVQHTPASLIAVGSAFRLSVADQATAAPIERMITQVATSTVYIAEFKSWQTRYAVTPTVQIGLPYAPDLLAGIDEMSLRLYRQNPQTGAWQAMPTVVNPASHQVWATTEQAGTYALFGRPQIRAIRTDLRATTPLTAGATLIMVDPDHGGSDPGGRVSAPAAFRTVEKTHNLQVALMLRDLLQACGVQVEMTRESDISVSTSQRAAMINARQPSAAVTVAFNIATGTMLNFNGGAMQLAPFDQPGSLALGGAINSTIGAFTGVSTHRGVQNVDTWSYCGGYCVGNMVTGVAHSQSESAFLDSYVDRAVIDQQPEAFANAIFTALAGQQGGASMCSPGFEFPEPLSAAERARLRALGLHNWQLYDGDPVSLSTGNHIHSFTDLLVPGVAGLDFELNRVYNALDTRDGVFANGWSSWLDMSLRLARDGSIDVRKADGAGIYFVADGEGYAPGQDGVFEILSRDGPDFLLFDPHSQRSYQFKVSGFIGRLTAISDAYGNTITLDRADDGRIASIRDSGGRTYAVSYSGEHIASITDPSGRVLRYAYDGDNDLRSATDGNGGVRQFTYQDHLLLTMTDPEGILYLQNTYDDQRRITRQVDASGSESSFTYADGETTFIDNAGNRTIARYDERSRVTEIEDALGQKQIFAYDDDYNVVSYTDKRDNTWTSTYDDRGNRLTYTDPLGKPTAWTYNERNQITSATDRGGPGETPRTTTFVYDSLGSLTSVIQPDKARTLATYDERGQRQTLTDANLHTTSYGYDSAGNLTSVTDPLGQITRYRPDAVGRVVEVSDANGHSTAIEYDRNDNVIRLSDPKQQPVRFSYDKNDNLTALIDRRGGVTTYAYDENLKLTAERDPEGHRTAYAYDAMYNLISTTDALSQTTRYRYDEIYQLKAVEDALQGVTTLDYDPNGNLLGVTDALSHTTTFAYDERNLLTTQIDALQGRTTYEYDAVGRLTTTVNPRTAATTYAYDLQDRVVEVRDALHGRWRFEYDKVGNVLALTDANDHTQRMRYDAADRLVERRDAEQHPTFFGYDAVGNTTVVTDALQRVTSYAYDANDNLRHITDALQGRTTLDYDPEDALVAITDANTHTTAFTRDLDGNLTLLREAGGQETAFDYDAAHNLIARTNAKGNTWRYGYDRLNRLTSETDPLDHTTAYGYDAVSNHIRTIDANGIATRYDYDALQRLIGVVQNERPGVPANHETNVLTAYEYDAVGNLTGIIDGRAERTSFVYDLLDRMTQETDPLAHSWRYRYDPAGNLIERVDPKAQRTSYAYDADNLLIEKTYSDNTRVSYAYDAVHNQTQMIDGLGVTTNTYDALNRLASSTNHVGQRVGYGYDPVGNRTSLQYPDGRSVLYAYDETNFVTRVTDPDGNAFVVTRDPTHNAVLIENPNDTVATYTIDAAERLTAVENRTNANPHEIISSFAYTLDPVGNRMRVDSAFRWRKPGQLSYDYAYDPLYRLTDSKDSLGHFTAYAYDAVGNRIRVTTNDDPTLKREIDTVTTTSTYDGANQLITSTREVNPRGQADRASQTAQALRAFAHEVRAQDGQHIDGQTAESLATQAAELIGALEGAQPPSANATEDALAALSADVEAAAGSGAIDNAGVATSLQAKLDHAGAANDRRSGNLLTTTYDYDQNGNRIRRTAPIEDTGNQRDWQKTEYSYDIENHLVHVQDFRNPGSGTWLPNDETFLIYDGYERVFRRQHDQHIGGGGDQHWIDYVYDGLDPIAEYRNPSPQYTNYYRGLGHILSQHDFKSQQSPQGTLYYYHYDGLDSVTGITKHQGQSVHNYRYHDYGTLLDINGEAADASNFTDPHNHYTLTGQEWDEYAELYHFYARDYDDKTGTWLTRDPYRGQLEDPKTLHRYGYVGGNPTTYKDLYGYSWLSTITGGVIGGIIGGLIGAGVGNVPGAIVGAVIGGIGGAYIGSKITSPKNNSSPNTNNNSPKDSCIKCQETTGPNSNTRYADRVAKLLRVASEINKNIDTATRSIQLILEAARNAGVNDPSQLAYILATAHHESYMGAVMEEAGYLSKEARESYYIKMYGKEEGLKYHGRGFVQLTWSYNYKKYADILGIDLVNHPELVSQPETAAKILVHGMVNGTYTGKKLSDYGQGDSFNYVGARAIVNGNDDDVEIANIAKRYAEILKE